MRYMPGDVVTRRKGLVQHKGVVLHDGRVLHNTPGRGEHISSMHEFANGERVRVDRQTYDARQRALRYAERPRGGDYHLLAHNCEHTVTRATTGDARSPQLVSWLAGVGAGAVALALTRHPAAAVAGYALGRKLGHRVLGR